MTLSMTEREHHNFLWHKVREHALLTMPMLIEPVIAHLHEYTLPLLLFLFIQVQVFPFLTTTKYLMLVCLHVP